MHTIYVPTFAAFKEDIESRLKLLAVEVYHNATYEGKFDIGLEIGGLAKHFSSQEPIDQIYEYMRSVAGGVKTVVHGFAGLEVYTAGIADMSDDVGKSLLERYIGLGKRLNSSYVHVHGSAGFQGIKEPENKSERLQRIRKNLLYGLSISDGIPIGLENLPSPSACDFDSNPETVWSDCVEQPEDVCEVIRGTPLKFTFDTAHYGINRGGYVDLTKPVKMLKDHLYHLHVVDCLHYWIPNISKAIDGPIPGDGRMGKESFENFFRYIRENHPDLGVCIEVRNIDERNPEQTREGVRRVLRWLG